MDQLDRVRIATPCPVKWSSMRGDDRSRFCSQCCLTVYNLSSMTHDEATRFVSQREGRTCVQFFRRMDGTILTRDCERGLRRNFELQLRRATPTSGTVWAIALTTIACFTIAVALTFADNIRALLGASSGGALAGDTVVTRRVAKPSNSRGLSRTTVSDSWAKENSRY